MSKKLVLLLCLTAFMAMGLHVWAESISLTLGAGYGTDNTTNSGVKLITKKVDGTDLAYYDLYDLQMSGGESGKSLSVYTTDDRFTLKATNGNTTTAGDLFMLVYMVTSTNTVNRLFGKLDTSAQTDVGIQLTGLTDITASKQKIIELEATESYTVYDFIVPSTLESAFPVTFWLWLEAGATSDRKIIGTEAVDVLFNVNLDTTIFS